MKFFNTLSRSVEEFRPISEGEVKFYSCGPTVYDFAQIGNLRAFVFVDTLRRSLELNGFTVNHVMNITDVGHLVSDMDEGEDKLEKGAAREGKTVWEVADFYIDAFEKDTHELNILRPNGFKGKNGPYARATDFIDQQIELVNLLFKNGFAYQTEEAIYFDTAKLASYGDFAGQKLDEKEVGARSDVITDSNKRHPQDFALWFFLIGRFKNHSMHWNSPWGDGFPGWHLECSAIIHATLGEPIDLHTGGIDHIGTHHTNEIAQTEAGYGHKLANYWLHNDFVLVDGKKMSKSLGNFYTLKDITDRGHHPLALRLLFLQAHYRSELNFTWDSLEAAAQNLRSLQAWADTLYQTNSLPQITNSRAGTVLEDIKASLDEDLNTAKGLSILNGLVETCSPSKKLLEALDSIFALNLSARRDIDEQQMSLILERQKARESKDWDSADKLREELLKSGLVINDTDAGPIWSRS